MTRIAAVVLAAGSSTRFAAQGGVEETKLVATLDDQPIVRRVVRAALASRARPVIVVVGHARRAVEEAIADLPAAIAVNPDYASGLASSLRVGLKTTPGDAGGAVVLLGDMPKVEAGLINALIDAFLVQKHARAVAPMQGGRRGNPVLLGRTLFEEAKRLSGDAGARRLLSALDSRSVLEIDADGFDVSFDIDGPSDLAYARRQKYIPRPGLGD